MFVIGTWNLENLYRPGGEFGPRDKAAYEAKLKALAVTVTQLQPTVLGVQEVGQPAALADLVELLGEDWKTALSTHPDHRGIRVGFLSRLPVTVLADVATFPAALPPLACDDTAPPTTLMARGALAVRVEPVPGHTLDVAVCHLKSKLLTFPGGRFVPRDEGERARYGAYALYRRAAEATTVRGLADGLLGGEGTTRSVAVLGDLNDEVQAATTQILLGPPGSEIGTPGASKPDKGDAWRLTNLAPLIPERERYSRINRGRRELIDHIMVSRGLLDRVEEVHSLVDRHLPSITDNPVERREATDSDHAPVFARVRFDAA